MWAWIFLKRRRICFGTQAVASTSCADFISAVVCVANSMIASANISGTYTGLIILFSLSSFWIAWS